jgi:hypothetical protein
MPHFGFPIWAAVQPWAPSAVTRPFDADPRIGGDEFDGGGMPHE